MLGFGGFFGWMWGDVEVVGGGVYVRRGVEVKERVFEGVI